MLEAVRPETRTQVRSHSGRFAWGIVDTILGLVMLPFGIWMWLIERMTRAVSALQKS